MREAPQFEKRVSEVSEAFSLEDTNKIQMELMELAGGDPLEWIQVYSEPFRALIHQEPELYQQYQEDHDACLAYIKKRLMKMTHH